ncbi:MAG TPA: hypothetical protein VM889_03880 [Candidatus Thermoplasmatota archaeon]|nr:hypothetical protein [Candidatus Thermoplasmatota archaeon]
MTSVMAWQETAEARKLDAAMRQCIENCMNCASICLETLAYVTAKGGDLASPERLRALADCAEMCRTSADFMLRGSPIHGEVCGACAAACEACEDACREMESDPQLAACAEACSACGETCRAMANG